MEFPLRLQSPLSNNPFFWDNCKPIEMCCVADCRGLASIQENEHSFQAKYQTSSDVCKPK